MILKEVIVLSEKGDFLEDFKEGEQVYKLPCGHIFSDSIFTWLKEESNKCPVCRYELSSKEVKNEDYIIDISNNTISEGNDNLGSTD